MQRVFYPACLLATLFIATTDCTPLIAFSQFTRHSLVSFRYEASDRVALASPVRFAPLFQANALANPVPPSFVAVEGNSNETVACQTSTSLSTAAKRSSIESVQGSLSNSLTKFQSGDSAHVAFLGGSITEMNGYRPIVTSYLEERFSDTEFEFTNAGIASTCSTTGAFRIQSDVLAKGELDLIFIEYAVNDDQDAAHPFQQAVRGMEGIIRQLRTVQPSCDIVIVYFCNPGIIQTLREGETPVSIAAHRLVADHYQVPTVDLAQTVAMRIENESLTWEAYGGTHPGPVGNQLAATLAIELLENDWNQSNAEEEIKPHPLPDEMVDPNSYANGRKLDWEQVEYSDAWQLAPPEWQSIEGSWRPRFREVDLLQCDVPEEGFSVSFEGNAIGLYVLAGPDAGGVRVSIDGGDWDFVDLYHRFSTGLHYPRTVMLAEGLEPGEHEAIVEIAPQRNAQSQGSAIRILAVVAN